MIVSNGLRHIDSRAHKYASIVFHPLIRAWSGALPPSVMAPTSSVMYQPTDSCTMHAVSAVLVPSLGFVASQSDGYKLARAMWRADQGLPLSTPMADEGASPSELSRSLSVFGCRPRATSPQFDAWNSDAEPATINDEIFADEFQADYKNVVVGQYSIADADLLQAALAATNKGATGAFYADQAFQNWSPGSPMGASSMVGGGWHQVAIKGYRITPAGRLWRVQNSWGTGWGDAGFFDATDEWVGGCTNMIAWDVRVQ